VDRARATATRCCCPPLSWSGRWWEWLGHIDGFEQFHHALFALCCSLAIEQERHFHVLVGGEGGDEREELEHKTDRPFAQVGALVAIEIGGSLSSMTTLPEVGLSRQPMSCSRVVLPEPEGPTRAVNSPLSNVQADAVQGAGFHLADFINTGDICQLSDFHDNSPLIYAVQGFDRFHAGGQPGRIE
jgi:hypothetical protein